MKKIKSLMPSLREKKRYIGFEVLSERPIGRTESVHYSIQQSMTSLLGQKGMATAGYIFLSDLYIPKSQRGAFRVSHDMVDAAKAALCCVTHIEQIPVIIRSTIARGMLHLAAPK